MTFRSPFFLAEQALSVQLFNRVGGKSRERPFTLPCFSLSPSHQALLLPSKLLYLVLPLLGLAANASQLLNTDGGLFHNRDVYSPSRRLLSDELPLNSNVTFVSKYSKPKTTGLTDLVAWDRYSVSSVSPELLDGEGVEGEEGLKPASFQRSGFER